MIIKEQGHKRIRTIALFKMSREIGIAFAAVCRTLVQNTGDYAFAGTRGHGEVEEAVNAAFIVSSDS